jgi:hypothetical protein
MQDEPPTGESSMWHEKLQALSNLQGHPVVEASMLSTSVASLGGMLPEVSAALPIVYYTIQIIDSDTVKRLRIAIVERYTIWRRARANSADASPSDLGDPQV